MTFRGAICFDDLYGTLAASENHEGDGNAEWGVMSRVGTAQPGAVAQGVSGLSRYSADYNTTVGGECNSFGENWAGSGTLYAYFCGVFTNNDAVTPGENGLFYSVNGAVNSAVAPATNANFICVGRVKQSSTTYKWQIYQWRGGSLKAEGTAGATTYTYNSTRHFVTVEMDLGANTVSVYVDGTTEKSAQSITNTIVADHPTLYNNLIAGGKSGGGDDKCIIDELIWNDDAGSDSRYTYDAIGDVHAVALYPISDSDTGWATNDCESLRARAVHDVELDRPAGTGTEDHCTVTGDGTNQDQTFGMEDTDAGATSMKGVHLFAGTDDADTPPDNVFLDDGTKVVGGTSGTPLLAGFGSSWRCGVYSTEPDAGAWSSPSAFDSMTAGIRNSSASTAETCHLFFAVLVADGLTRRGGQSLYVDCPAASQRVFITHS